jgi:hypothetical protein
VLPKTEQEEAHKFLHHLSKITQASQNSTFATYSKKVIKMSATFERKYGNKPRLKCMTCKKYTLTHGELIGQIYTQSIDAFVDTLSFSNAAKNLMDQAFEIFPQKPLNELIDFMLQAANELPIPCELCHGTHWAILA